MSVINLIDNTITPTALGIIQMDDKFHVYSGCCGHYLRRGESSAWACVMCGAQVEVWHRLPVEFHLTGETFSYEFRAWIAGWTGWNYNSIQISVIPGT